MRRRFTLASLATLLVTVVPMNAAFADPAETTIEDLHAQLTALKSEQQATERRIEELEGRIIELEGRVSYPSLSDLNAEGSTALNDQARLSNTEEANLRGRGVGGVAPDSAAASDEPTSPPAADEESRKEPAKTAAVEAVTRDQQGYFGQAFSIEPGLTYSHFSTAQLNLNGFLALDAIFLGLISIDQTNSDVITADLTGRYGFGRFQADVNIPYLYRRSTFISGGAGGNASGLIERTITTHGLGDISGGLSYRVVAETAAWPDIVLNIRGKAPTGGDPFGVELIEVQGSEGNLKIPSRLSTGNGVWAASAGVSVLKTIDPMVVFGSLNYFYTFKHHFDDLDEAINNQPGEARLGNALQYALGVAFALNDRSSLNASFTQRFVSHAKLKFDPLTQGEDASWQTVVGSEANVAELNLGATFSLTDRLTLLTNLAVGISQDAPDMVFMVHLPYSF